MPHISRFIQLLLFTSLVLFIPTVLYLRPSSGGPSITSAQPVLSSQGHGPMAGANDGANWTWPGDKWFDPARLKAGDYWKNWKDHWSQQQGSGSGNVGAQVASAPTQPATPLPPPPAVAVVSTVLPAPSPAPTTPALGFAPPPFAPKMANATAKAELGRSTWKFLHTMTLRFPDTPTTDQRATLASFFHNFALLYPCGDCASHFQTLLKAYPPQTSSRMNASLWLCSMHNMVNARLGKEEFPCDKLDETYDCGCGGPPGSSSSATASPFRMLLHRRSGEGQPRGAQCEAACQAAF